VYLTSRGIAVLAAAPMLYLAGELFGSRSRGRWPALRSRRSSPECRA